MIYPDPTYHFPVDFRPDWLDLTWTIDDTDLAEAALDYNLGRLLDLRAAGLDFFIF